MTAKKTDENSQTQSVDTAEKKKTCFAIMPIADHPDYSANHFTRVYNHLIIPACEKAGYKVIRADDAKASHMIMFDILKNIVECDMAICDLSSKNANVFYELGLRQAFNKKTILITDDLTSTPFDITGFRYVKYSSSLRIDTVSSGINEIASMLKETDEADDSDINSIVNLLRIQPAKLNKIELNEHESVLYQMISKLDSKISFLTRNDISHSNNKSGKSSNTNHLKVTHGMTFDEVSEINPSLLDALSFQFKDEIIGKYFGMDEDGLLLFKFKDSEFHISNRAFERSLITII